MTGKLIYVRSEFVLKFVTWLPELKPMWEGIAMQTVWMSCRLAPFHVLALLQFRSIFEKQLLVEAFLIRVEAVHPTLILSRRGSSFELELSTVHHGPQQGERFGTHILTPVAHSAHQVGQISADTAKVVKTSFDKKDLTTHLKTLPLSTMLPDTPWATLMASPSLWK